MPTNLYIILVIVRQVQEVTLRKVTTYLLFESMEAIKEQVETKVVGVHKEAVKTMVEFSDFIIIL